MHFGHAILVKGFVISLDSLFSLVLVPHFHSLVSCLSMTKSSKVIHTKRVTLFPRLFQHVMDEEPETAVPP